MNSPDSHILEYEIKTKVEDSCILHDISYNDPLTGIRKTLIKTVTDTQEEQLRNALIQLGWTPPKENKNVK